MTNENRQMRIAYISLAQIPSTRANSVQVMKMCQAFLQEGVTLTLYAPDTPTMAMGASLADHYGLEVDVPIVRLPGIDRLRGHSYRWRAISAAKQEEGTSIFTRDFAVAFLSTRRGAQTLLEVHDMPFTRANRSYLASSLRSPHLAKLIPISHALNEALAGELSRRVTPENTLVLPDGVDLERFADAPSRDEARSKLELGERPVIGYVGHLYPGRGVDMILDLARSFGECQFVLVGGDESSVRSVRSTAEAGAMSNIRIEGFVDNRLVPTYLAACDVLLMPYGMKVSASGGGDISRFMSPMKMFEYMASGVAMLVSDLPVLHEVLNQHNCTFARPKDLDDWVQKLRWLLEHPAERQRLGQQAHEDVQTYTWRSRAQAILRSFTPVPS